LVYIEYFHANICYGDFFFFESLIVDILSIFIASLYLYVSPLGFCFWLVACNFLVVRFCYKYGIKIEDLFYLCILRSYPQESAGL